MGTTTVEKVITQVETDATQAIEQNKQLAASFTQASNASKQLGADVQGAGAQGAEAEKKMKGLDDMLKSWRQTQRTEARYGNFLAMQVQNLGIASKGAAGEVTRLVAAFAFGGPAQLAIVALATAVGYLFHEQSKAKEAAAAHAEMLKKQAEFAEKAAESTAKAYRSFRESQLGAAEMPIDAQVTQARLEWDKKIVELEAAEATAREKWAKASSSEREKIITERKAREDEKKNIQEVIDWLETEYRQRLENIAQKGMEARTEKVYWEETQKLRDQAAADFKAASEHEVALDRAKRQRMMEATNRAMEALDEAERRDEEKRQEVRDYFDALTLSKGNRAHADEIARLDKEEREKLELFKWNEEMKAKIKGDFAAQRLDIEAKYAKKEEQLMHISRVSTSANVQAAMKSWRDYENQRKRVNVTERESADLIMGGLDALGAAVEDFTKGNIENLAKQAAIEAAIDTAKGLAALALAYLGSPGAGMAATAYFEAAAVNAAVAGLAAGVAAMMGGGGGGGAAAPAAGAAAAETTGPGGTRSAGGERETFKRETVVIFGSPFMTDAEAARYWERAKREADRLDLARRVNVS